MAFFFVHGVTYQLWIQRADAFYVQSAWGCAYEAPHGIAAVADAEVDMWMGAKEWFAFGGVIKIGLFGYAEFFFQPTAEFHIGEHTLPTPLKMGEPFCFLSSLQGQQPDQFVQLLLCDFVYLCVQIEHSYISPVSMPWKNIGLRKWRLSIHAEACSFDMSCSVKGKDGSGSLL